MKTQTQAVMTEAEESHAQALDEQFCTFHLGDLLFGVEVRSVQEVLLKQRVTRLPLVDEVVSGLINLRGQIVTAFDMRKLLDMPPLPPEHDQMNVVIRSGDSPYALVVDGIGDVVNVSPDAFEEPPDTLQGVARELVLGTYKLEGSLLLVLDTERAITLDRF